MGQGMELRVLAVVAVLSLLPESFPFSIVTPPLQGLAHSGPARSHWLGASPRHPAARGALRGPAMAAHGHQEEGGAVAAHETATIPAAGPRSADADEPNLVPRTIPGARAADGESEPKLVPRMYPEPIVQPAEAEHTATIIYLHGFNSRGAGRGFEMAERLNLPWCKVILPQAPVYSLPGQDFQSWAALDPFSLGRHAVEVLPDQASHVGSVANRMFGGPAAERISLWEGLQELVSGVAVVGPFKRLEGTREDRLANARYVGNLIESEVRRGIPRERIVVIGYSQGGSIALSILFDLGIRVGAFVGLCTWFPTTLEPPREHKQALEALPALFCHGTSDMVVPLPLGRKALENCKNIGMKAKMSVYEGMGHDISDAVVRDVRRFLQECLPRVAPLRGEKIRKIHEIPLEKEKE